MTENEYLSWTSPTAILKCLGARATRHQYLLFLCACWRRRPDVLASPRQMLAVKLYEEVFLGEREVEALRASGDTETHRWVETVLAMTSFAENRLFNLVELSRDAVMKVHPHSNERLAQVNLLRCIVGNPYTPAAVDPAWLRWNDGVIPRLAVSIHQERRFGELPVLADALEEAGCDDSDILGHCRTRREHALGCWVLSLLRSRLTLRLVLAGPETRLSGWRPDMVELTNVSPEPITLAYRHSPFEGLGLLTLDAAGEVVDHQTAMFAEEAWVQPQTIALASGETLRHHLGPTRTLPPGIYTMQALFRHEGIDMRSRAFLFTVSAGQ